MKLLKMTMVGFRAYREKTEVNFRDGVNVFSGRNESGKSSLLKAVQYALFPPSKDAERRALISEGGDVCSVTLEYEAQGGEKYVLERDFAGKKHSLSENRDGVLTPLASNQTEVARYVQEHTGCDEQLFNRTLMVSHEAIEVPPDETLARVLGQRLEFLMGGGPVSAAKAAQKLDEGYKKLAGPHKGEIVSLEMKLDEARAAFAKAADAAKKTEETANRLEQAAREIHEAVDDVAANEVALKKAEEVAPLKEEHERLTAEVQRLDGALAAQEEFEAAKAESTAFVAAKGGGKAPRSAWAGMVLSAVIAGVSAWVAFGLGGSGMSPYVGTAYVVLAVAAAAFIVSIALIVVLKRKIRDKKTGAQIAELEKKLAVAEARWEALSQGTAPSALRERKLQTQAELAALSVRMREVAVYQLDAFGRAKVERKLEGLRESITRLESQKSADELALRSLAAAAGEAAGLEDEVSVLERRLERSRARARSLRMACEKLEEATADLRQGVGPEVAQTATERLSKVIPDYRVSLEEGPSLAFVPAHADGRKFTNRELSDGTADQFYFALRTALADVLLGDVNPPLFLDDPFRYSDDSRVEELNGLLLEISDARQILYFTVSRPAGLVITHEMPLNA